MTPGSRSFTSRMMASMLENYHEAPEFVGDGEFFAEVKAAMKWAWDSATERINESLADAINDVIRERRKG